MIVVMLAFAVLIPTMFVATIISSLQEAGREKQDLVSSQSRYRIL